METIKITSEEEIKLYDIADLLCSAFDPMAHAVSYWAEISGSVKPDKITYPATGTVYDYMHWPLNEGGSLLIKDIEADNGETYILNLESIKRGLQTMTSAYPRHWADFVSDNADNTTADVFIQCCLLGEVKYG